MSRWEVLDGGWGTVWFLHRLRVATSMAKSDSFFIRAAIALDAAGTYAQSAIDLGAYVDALGKSVLRIHNVSASIRNSFGNFLPTAGAGTDGQIIWQLTTQSQGAIVPANDRSLISSGALLICNQAGPGAGAAGGVYMDSDVLPQEWTNGYLVGVEQIYLGGDTSNTGSSRVDIVMECTVETLSQSGAMALALSQQ